MTNPISKSDTRGVLMVGAAITLLAACGDPKATEPPEVSVRVSGPPPVPSATLNAAYRDNLGLLTGVASDGKPMLPPIAGADPMIEETLRFYDTLQTPFPISVPVDYPDPFTGEPTPERKTAPMDLDEWKRVFGFSAREAEESVEAYRERTGIAVYYNRNELGLGRQLGCSRFVDGTDANGAPLKGVACFVTNHGAGFRQATGALQAAIDDIDTRNTVCITYRPSMDPGYQVQFYVYGPKGKRQEWARLDTMGPRPHPQVCTTCHGGAYDQRRHLVKNARFLPLDPTLVAFAVGSGLPAGLTRAGQEERIRVFNAMAVETPLTPAQQAMVSGLYPDGVKNPGSTVTGDGVPATWNTRAGDADFYRAVVKPFCATCHLAMKRGLADSDVWSHGIFASPAAFDAAPLDAYVCNSFSMPNAQPTALAFWDRRSDGDGIVVDGQMFPTAADALFSRRGFDASMCGRLADVAGCNRGPDPDALCGGAVSGGATCDRASGRCVPVVGSVE